MARAIERTGLAAPLAGAALPTLQALAAEVERQIGKRQQAIDAAAATALERITTRQGAEARRAEADAALASAGAELAPLLERLLLAPSEPPALARTRLAEFDALLSARQALASVQLQAQRHRDTLMTHARQAAIVAEALGEPTPEADRLRVFIDRVAQRRGTALALQDQRHQLQHRLADAQTQQQAQQETVSVQQALLDGLCSTAGVAHAAALPEAEDRSARRRQAEDRRTDLERQLASASRRSAQALHDLMAQEDITALHDEEQACADDIATLERSEAEARHAEEAARRALEAVDTGDGAAAARAGMELAAAAVRASVGPWVRARLAQALLQEATGRFRERAQGPMLQSASRHFAQITGGEFTSLQSDESDNKPVLLAQRAGGRKVAIEALSEGTRDQLYLALRLAALELRRDGGADLPVTLDDVLMTSDDQRAAHVMRALKRFSAGTQVIVFTHHQHLVDVAKAACGGAIGVVQLG